MRTSKRSMGPNLSLTAAYVGVMALTHLCEAMSLQELHVGEKDTAASSVSKLMVALRSIERKVAANGRNNFTARFVKNIQNLKILVNTVGFLPAGQKRQRPLRDNPCVTMWLPLQPLLGANNERHYDCPKVQKQARHCKLKFGIFKDF
ncbi:hypothetical protein PoB_006716800 [Plakobranchus ocellatus]|uniref:Uncharacterized protein n=1 Tax=Plakobranchus ocellatus TaxID=259542 RepID=A0AAV4D8U0_9GAST|nr:hypothetical protein PoB_006716800 [Plakobranchus ocellatus]